MIFNKKKIDVKQINVLCFPYTPSQCVLRNAAPVPTHFFVILTGCSNPAHSPTECKGPLNATTFILPHRPDRQEMCGVSWDQHCF